MPFRIAFVCLMLLPLAACHSAGPPVPAPGTTAEVDWHQKIVVFTGSDRLSPLRSDERARNQQTLDLLQKPLSYSAEDVPLDEVIAFLRDVTGADIVVNWPELDLGDISREMPVTLQMNQGTAGQLLDYALAMASAEQFDDDKAGYEIADGAVNISRIADINTRTLTRIYDIRLLLSPYAPDLRLLYPDQPVAVEQTLIKMGELSMRPWDAQTQTPPQKGIFGDEIQYSTSRSILELVASITELIKDTVGDQGEWLDEVSTLREQNGLLIIKTTRNNHRQIEDLLVAMHQAQATRFEQKARLVEVFALLQQAEAFRLDQRYREALRIIDQALRVDPENTEARALREIVVGAMQP